MQNDGSNEKKEQQSSLFFIFIAFLLFNFVFISISFCICALFDSFESKQRWIVNSLNTQQTAHTNEYLFYGDRAKFFDFYDEMNANTGLQKCATVIELLQEKKNKICFSIRIVSVCSLQLYVSITV